MTGVVAGHSTKAGLKASPFRSIYDGPFGQFVAVKARTKAARERSETSILKRHGAKPLFRINIIEVKP